MVENAITKAISRGSRTRRSKIGGAKKQLKHKTDRMQLKSDAMKLAHREINTMNKKKRRAAVTVVTWRRKATKVNTARTMPTNKQSVAVRQNAGKSRDRLAANKFVPKSLLDGVMAHSRVTL